jgi:hypothetical protein
MQGLTHRCGVLAARYAPLSPAGDPGFVHRPAPGRMSRELRAPPDSRAMEARRLVPGRKDCSFFVVHRSSFIGSGPMNPEHWKMNGEQCCLCAPAPWFARESAEGLSSRDKHRVASSPQRRVKISPRRSHTEDAEVTEKKGFLTTDEARAARRWSARNVLAPER